MGLTAHYRGLPPGHRSVNIVTKSSVAMGKQGTETCFKSTAGTESQVTFTSAETSVYVEVDIYIITFSCELDMVPLNAVHHLKYISHHLLLI